MWNNSWTNGDMIGWGDSAWHGFFGFHGILSVILLALIVAVVIALFRDQTLERGNETNHAPRNHG